MRNQAALDCPECGGLASEGIITFEKAEDNNVRAVRNYKCVFCKMHIKVPGGRKGRNFSEALMNAATTPLHEDTMGRQIGFQVAPPQNLIRKRPSVISVRRVAMKAEEAIMRNRRKVTASLKEVSGVTYEKHESDGHIVHEVNLEIVKVEK